MKKRILGTLIGLFIAFTILEIGIIASAKIFNFYQEKLNAKDPNLKKPLTIVVIGESTTAVSANEENNRLVQETAYPYFLEKKLKEKIKNRDIVVINKGIMAGDSTKIVLELGNYLNTNKADAIVVMMGMKDLIQHETKAPDSNWWDSVVEVLAQTHTYQLIQLAFDQKALHDKNIDDSKEVKTFEDMPKIFLDEYSREVYLDASFSEKIPTLSNEEFSETIKNNLLGNYFHRTGQYEKAQEIFESSYKKNGMGALLLTTLFLRNNKFNEAKNLLEEVLSKNEKNTAFYKNLILLYLSEKKLDQADAVYARAKKHNLDRSIQLKMAKSQIFKEKMEYKKGINELNAYCGVNFFDGTEPKPRSIDFKEMAAWQKPRVTYHECLYYLVNLQYLNNDLDIAEKNAYRLMKMSPKAFYGLELIQKIHEKQGKKEKATEIFMNLLKANNRLGEYFALADFYRSIGKNDDEIKNVYDSAAKNFPVTLKNFKFVSQLAAKKDAKLIIMQYPTFSLEFLSYFTKDIKSAYYVDNEHLFDNAPKNKFFFEPRFPYQFNHYTKLGAELIAENLSNHIVKMVNEGKL